MVVQLLCLFNNFLNTIFKYIFFVVVRLGLDQDLQCAECLTGLKNKFPDRLFSSSSVWKNSTDFQPFRARYVRKLVL